MSVTSKTIQKIVSESLAVKYFIRPVPSLEHSIAISAHFKSLSPHPVVQYRQARDVKAATPLNSFRVIYRDPLPLALQEPAKSTGEIFQEWKKCAMLVNQRSYHAILNEFGHRYPAPKTVSEILDEIQPFTPAPTDLPTVPNPQKSIWISNPPSELELELLKHSRIVLDSNNNVVPMAEYVEADFSNEDLPQNQTAYTLDLCSMSRDSQVVLYTTQMGMLDQSKIDRSLPFLDRLKAFKTRRRMQLHGFRGDIKFGQDADALNAADAVGAPTTTAS